MLALWVIGLVGFLALRDDSSSNNVAVPTQPPSTSIAPATTTVPLTTTTTKPPDTTTSTKPPPTITVVPPPPTTTPPTQPPTTGPPPTTVAPTTVAPTTVAPTTTEAPTTSKPPPTTTPDEGKAAKVQNRLEQRVGPSNRGVPADERFVVSYTPGKDLLVTWAINNGTVGEHPTGTPTCSTPPTEPPASSTSSTGPTTSTTTTTTTTAPGPPPSSAAGRTTPEQARFEAKQVLASIRGQLTTLKLDVPGVQLVGTYPLEGTTESDVVQVLYSKATVQSGIGDYHKAFDVPPAEARQCLNPAFDL